MASANQKIADIMKDFDIMNGSQVSLLVRLIVVRLAVLNSKKNF